MVVEFSEWQKLELKTAKIIEVEDIEGKDKLYKLKIDLGGEQRQLVAGNFTQRKNLKTKQLLLWQTLNRQLLAVLKARACF